MKHHGLFHTVEHPVIGVGKISHKASKWNVLSVMAFLLKEGVEKAHFLQSTGNKEYTKL